MPIINIKVEGKKATLTETVDIVCGNKDYVVAFDFDAEWSAQQVKTARFVYYSGNGAKAHEVTFTGNQAPVPILLDTQFVLVGVYAGDLVVTTPAEVKCLRGILDLGGEHEEPSEDIYIQLLELLAAGEVQRGANTLACHVDAGDATELTVKEEDLTVPTGYAVKAGDLVLTADGKVLSVVSTLDPETIELKAEGIDLALKCYEQVKRYADDNYLGALKASASGEVVRVDDVAAIEHAVAVKVRGKNMLNPNGESITLKGITFTNNGDGSFSVSGTSEGAVSFALTNLTKSPLYLAKGKPYTQSVNVLKGAKGEACAVVPAVKDVDGNITWNYFDDNQTRTPDKDYSVYAYTLYINGGATVDFTFTVQLEEGNTATDFEPYIDPTTVRVTRCGADETDRPETYTPNADGTVEGVRSVGPTMTLLTDTEGVIIEAEYNQDINVIADDMEAALDAILAIQESLIGGGA